MGINNFYKNVEILYKNIYSNKKYYDHIHFDIMFYLYKYSYCSENISILFKYIFHKILIDINRYKILKTVNFYTDNGYIKSKYNTNVKRKINRDKYTYNNLCDEFKKPYFYPLLKENFIQFSNKNLLKLKLKIFYYFDDFGEGEIKIKKNIKKINESHLIIINDSDVLLLLSSLNKTENIYIIFKENILNINKLLIEHCNIYGKSNSYNIDYIFLNLLQGNDYFPKLKFITYEKIWNAYQKNLYKHSKGLCNKNLKINYKFLFDILINIIGATKFNFIKNCNYFDYNEDLYDNYMKGLIWCLNLYINNTNNYDYTYEYTDSPHPLILYIYLLNNIWKNKKILLKK